MQLNGKFVTKVTKKKKISIETDLQITQISELPNISNN